MNHVFFVFAFLLFFFLIPASIAEAVAVTPSGAKIFLPKEQLLSLMDLQIFLIINIKIAQLELFRNLSFRKFYISFILLSNAFLSFVFALFVSNNS